MLAFIKIHLQGYLKSFGFFAKVLGMSPNKMENYQGSVRENLKLLPFKNCCRIIVNGLRQVNNLPFLFPNSLEIA